VQSAGGPGEEGGEEEEEEEEEELRNRGAGQRLMQLEHLLARLCRLLQRWVLRGVWMAAAPLSPTPAQREHVSRRVTVWRATGCGCTCISCAAMSSSFMLGHACAICRRGGGV
jgi:hypothetical protein